MKTVIIIFGVPVIALAIGFPAMFIGRLRQQDAVENLGRWLVGLSMVAEVVAGCIFLLRTR